MAAVWVRRSAARVAFLTKPSVEAQKLEGTAHGRPFVFNERVRNEYDSRCYALSK